MVPQLRAAPPTLHMKMGRGQTDAPYPASLAHCDQEENDITFVFLKPVQAVGGF